ncbi:uncharacterized protein V1516DRAFT_664207 [Lipomyces oligophaga]|uniref:uncharacterized protein n=1 Tax=Lipomyces oligophaga TaxID=45792 RepID=UPI0034CE2C00
MSFHSFCATCEQQLPLAKCDKLYCSEECRQSDNLRISNKHQRTVSLSDTFRYYGGSGENHSLSTTSRPTSVYSTSSGPAIPSFGAYGAINESIVTYPSSDSTRSSASVSSEELYPALGYRFQRRTSLYSLTSEPPTSRTQMETGRCEFPFEFPLSMKITKSNRN